MVGWTLQFRVVVIVTVQVPVVAFVVPPPPAMQSSTMLPRGPVIILIKRRKTHPLVVISKRIASRSCVVRVMDCIVLSLAIDLEVFVRSVKSISVPVLDVNSELILSLVGYRVDVFVAQPVVAAQPTEPFSIFEPAALEIGAAICASLQNRPLSFVVEQTVDLEWLAAGWLNGIDATGSTPVVK